MPGANPSWQGPWESALMETSEREKLMGTLCQGNEENKKPATEIRTSRRPPSTGAPQALWQPAHVQGSAGQGSPPRGSRRHGSAIPGSVLVEEAEVGKKNPGRCGDVQGPVPNPSRTAVQAALSPAHQHQGQHQPSFSVDGPIPGV